MNPVTNIGELDANYNNNLNLPKIEKITFGIALIALIFFISSRLIHQYIYTVYDFNYYIIVHTLLEFFSINVSFSIAILGYIIFPKTLSRYRLLIGGVFLSIGILDLLHTITYLSIPVFQNENLLQESLWFWIFARLTESLPLLIGLGLSDKRITKYNRGQIYLLFFSYNLIIVTLIMNFNLPVLFIEGQGTTNIKNLLEYIIILFHVITILVLLYRYQKIKNKTILTQILAIVFLIISELFFTLYQSYYDLDNLLGHVYKIVGYYLLLKGIYFETIEEPYTKQITERKKYEEKIKNLAYYDPLTGLPNRNYLYENLDPIVKKSKNLLAILQFDIDRFKFVVDTLGYETGDIILVEVKERIKEILVNENYLIIRMGADEFTIVLNNMSNREHVSQVAAKIVKSFSIPFKIGEREIFLTASLGISLPSSHGQDSKVLLQNSEIAMYNAKTLGGNNFQFYQSKMNDLITERLNIENKLYKALERNEFLLVYQPQFDTFSHKIIGIEALLRWKPVDADFISPAQFVPLAEETGLIIPIGDWVLRQACRQNKYLQERGFKPIVVAVNLSARQFKQDNLVETVANALKDTGLEARYLELEITESIAMHNEDYVISTLSKLKDLGINISIDDFGTGYSSFNYLRKFPINSLKIDKTFIDDIMIDQDAKAITSSIITMGHSLGLKIIAEGVEVEEQLNFLMEYNCDVIQGYIFSPPIDNKSLESFLRR